MFIYYQHPGYFRLGYYVKICKKYPLEVTSYLPRVTTPTVK